MGTHELCGSRLDTVIQIANEEAAQHLLDLWHTQNAIEQQDWDAQQELNAEQQHLALENRQREEEDAQRAKLQEEEEARKEERKKNHSKFLPFADVLPSSTIPITPLPLTLRKLRKGEYIPFYFFTNKGLADAQSISQSTDEDALAFMPDEQGIHSLIPIASAKAKQSIVQDQDLTWAQLDEATHCILQAMKEADWPQDCLNAMLQFWMNLGTDEWPHDADETARQVLIIYQAMYRCWWHDTLGTNSSFNPRHINQEALIRIKVKLVDQHYQITEKRAKEASTFPLSYPPKFLPLTLPSNLSPLLLFLMLHVSWAIRPHHTLDRTHYMAPMHMALHSLSWCNSAFPHGGLSCPMSDCCHDHAA